jgi:glycosyltransferase involved in cell wall biosynthesis
VREVIEHGANGLLVDFFDIDGWIDTVSDCLANPENYSALRDAARQAAVERYDLAGVCLPQQMQLVEKLAREA